MNLRLKKVQEEITSLELDAFLVTGPENRRYLSGFTGSSGLLVVSPKEACLITDFRYLEQAEKEAPDFEILTPTGLPDETLTDLISRKGYKNLGFEAAHLTYVQFQNYQEKLSPVNLVATRDLVEKLREAKNDLEVAAIKQAVRIADEAFDHILQYMRPGVMEKEIAAELEYFMKKAGSEKAAFSTIVASGHRAALPHGIAAEKILVAGDLVVLDFGAVYKGYHSDITRTVVLGKATAEQKKVYNIVLEAQQAAIDNIKPGEKCMVVDQIAREHITNQGYGSNFGHGLGHSVGLAIHEKPAFAPKDQTVLKEGMVLTVEPGIYIRDWGGVRIEDIIVVTSSSVEILTKSTKKLMEL